MPFLLGHREAKIVYDLTLSQSLISRRYADSILNLLQSDNQQLTMSVSVPCIGGYFTLELKFNICPHLVESDAILGSDWMNLCRMAVEDSVVSFLSYSPEAALHQTPMNSSLTSDTGGGTSVISSHVDPIYIFCQVLYPTQIVGPKEVLVQVSSSLHS